MLDLTLGIKMMLNELTTICRLDRRRIRTRVGFECSVTIGEEIIKMVRIYKKSMVIRLCRQGFKAN